MLGKNTLPARTAACGECITTLLPCPYRNSLHSGNNLVQIASRGKDVENLLLRELNDFRNRAGVRRRPELHVAGFDRRNHVVNRMRPKPVFQSLGNQCAIIRQARILVMLKEAEGVAGANAVAANAFNDDCVWLLIDQ